MQQRPPPEARRLPRNREKNLKIWWQPLQSNPMRILLQQRPAAGEPPRYLQLTLQPDLFGGWELLRESGQLGGRAQLRREQYLLQAEATAAFEKARDSQLKRGYQLMFVSGAEPPK